ncbi:MAG TPA: SCO6880 family protein, partial [Acidimicrobiia bacterium]
MTAVDAPRRYRFGPLDRSGWLLGLGAVPCLVLGAGFLAAGLTLKATGSAPLAATPLAVAAVAAFARYEGRAAHEWIAPLLGWASLRSSRAHRWAARVPLLGGDVTAPDLPPFLEGLVVQERPAGRPRTPRASGVGLVLDPHAQLVSATVRVQGDAFALLEHDDQARVLDSWGAALAGFCRERGAVTRLTWSEWAAPASLEEHLGFVRDQHGDRAPGPHWRDYVELVGRAGPLTIAHETLITLTVHRRRTRPGGGPDPAIDALLDEVEL